LRKQDGKMKVLCNKFFFKFLFWKIQLFLFLPISQVTIHHQNKYLLRYTAVTVLHVGTTKFQIIIYLILIA